MLHTDSSKYIEFRLLEGQADLVLEALQLYAFIFHKVWAIDKDSELEDLRNTLLFYTYETISNEIVNTKREGYDVMGNCRLERKRKKKYLYDKAKKNIA